MSSAKSRTGTLFQNGLAAAVRLTALAAMLAPAAFLPTAAALAQPSTSGGNLPYIATGQSEDEIQQRKRARAEADERARQEAARAAEEERVRQDAARATAQPEPVLAPSASAPAVTATVPPAATPSDPTKAKTVARPRPTDLPPGVSPNAVAAEPRVAPPQQRTAVMPPPAQPQHGVVVVRRPMFFGLFGPEVNVTERVVILTPPANIGSTQAGPRPPAPIAAPRVVNRRPAENCHYHTRQVPGMGYAHSDIQCHWHQEPNHPSLRYVD